MSERPTGGDMTSAFAAALERAESTPAPEASPASTPATALPAETPAPAATTQAATEPQGPESVNTTAEEPPKGEPPKWRWQDILANARETTAKETEARIRQELESQYTGLKDFSGIHPNERMGLLVWHRALAGDPAAQAQIAAATRQNPALAATLQGMLASEAATSTAKDQEPEHDLQAPDGTLYRSPAQQARHDEWLMRQMLSKFEERLKPFEQDRAQTQSERATAAFSTTTSQVIAKMAAADPDFKTHAPKVAEAINGDPRLMKIALGDSAKGIEPDPELAIETAWGRVYRSQVLPAKQQQTQQASEATVLANLQRSAVASAVNPSAPANATPKKFATGERGFAEALEHFAGA